jgi:hypothetical protein
MSDLFPTVADPNATTAVLKRKTMAIKISPETTANIQLGSIITGAGALVIATIFVWSIKTNSETAMADGKAMRDEVRAEFKAIRSDLQPVKEKVDRLWWEYERACTNTIKGVGP